MSLSNCVRVEQKPLAIEEMDSVKLTLRVDSAAIYRCDSCAFARNYLRQASGQVKDCKTCPWVSLAKPKHDKGDVPEISNQPVNPLHEQDAVQHGTAKLVMADSGDTPAPVATSSTRPSNDIVASNKQKGDGL